jgi:hypothetical protein
MWIPQRMKKGIYEVVKVFLSSKMRLYAIVRTKSPDGVMRGV